MAGVLKPVGWGESAEELRALYRGERDVERRKRVQALWLLRRGVTEAETARVVGVGRRTVVRWLGWYRAGGLREVVERLPGHGAPGGTRWLTEEQCGGLVAHASTGAFHTYEDARRWVLQEYGVEYRYKGMYGVLARLGVHPEAPRPRAAKADPDAQEAWKKGGLA